MSQVYMDDDATISCIILNPNLSNFCHKTVKHTSYVYGEREREVGRGAGEGGREGKERSDARDCLQVLTDRLDYVQHTIRPWLQLIVHLLVTFRTYIT